MVYLFESNRYFIVGGIWNDNNFLVFGRFMIFLIFIVVNWDKV